MAAIANYKDKLLQSYPYDRVEPSTGIGSVEWPDVLDTAGLKPEDNSTLGAAFDVNIPNTANTHNITPNAVSEAEFDETYVYNAGTEVMEISVDLNSYGNTKSILFISGTYESNYNSSASTTARSRIIMTVHINSTLIWSGEISVVPNQENSYFVTSFSDVYGHQPTGTGDTVFLITDSGAFLSPNNDDYLVAGKNGFETNTYTIGFEYISSCDGVRGRLYHVSVYGLVLKR